MSVDKFNITTAILIDGGFYKKRAFYYCGSKTPKERADELEQFCHVLLTNKRENRRLYRIFYYDCPPINKKVYHPLLDCYLTSKTQKIDKQKPKKAVKCFKNETSHRFYFANINFSSGFMKFFNSILRLFFNCLRCENFNRCSAWVQATFYKRKNVSD